MQKVKLSRTSSGYYASIYFEETPEVSVFTISSSEYRVVITILQQLGYDKLEYLNIDRMPEVDFSRGFYLVAVELLTA